MKFPRSLHVQALCLLFVCVLSPLGAAQLIKPDLWITKLSTSTSSYKEGARVSVTFTVKQEKALTSSAACYAGVYLSFDSGINTTDRLMASTSIPKLGNNATATRTLYFTVPNVGDRTCYIGAFADRTRIVAETNEANNGRGTAVRCFTKKADISVKSLTCSSLDLSPGDAVTFTLEMASNGDLAVPTGLKATYYLSEDPTVTTTDMAMGTFSLPAQAAVATSAKLEHKLFVPTLPACGNCWVGVILDYDNALTEHREYDNISTWNTTTRLPMAFYDSSPGHEPGKSFVGTAANDYIGWKVADAGDCNGDGYNDIIYGAWRYSSDRGLARVINGKDGSTLHTILGVTAGERVGYQVAGAGDVNADGFHDFIVSSPYTSPKGTYSGSAKVYNGKTGSVLHTVDGTLASQFTGWSVAGLGDTDGDGYDDFAVGQYSGAILVHSGRTGALRLKLTYHSGAGFGWAIAGCGDVNGDGMDDIVAGEPIYGSYRGGVVIFSGADGKLIKFLAGPVAGSRFGTSVACAGDLNGDRIPDVLVGAPFQVGTGSLRGAVLAYSGKDWTLLNTFTGKTTATNRNYVGNQVSGAGDLNSDGVPDIITGGYYGGVTAISGKDKALLCWFDGREGTTVRDLNQDGVPDIVIGNYAERVSTFSNAGSVRIYQSTGKTVGIARSYGAGCPGAAKKMTRHDFLGTPNLNEKVTLRLWGVNPGTQVALVIGFAKTTVDFGLFGAPGCTSHTMPGLEVYLASDIHGRVTLPVSMPSGPNLVGKSIYTTFWAIDLNANALKVVTSNGVQLNVGKL